MPSPSFLNELSDEDAKNVLTEICRSPASAQNLERIIRCLLHFWDSARCALIIDKDFVPEIFSDLKYGPESVENVDLSTLSILDIKVFLHLCLHCAYVRSERTKEKAGTNTRKFPLRNGAEQLTTESQRRWWFSAWSLSHDAGKQEDRIRLQEGLETLRLKSRDLPELPLLLSVAAMLENEVPDASRYGSSDAKAISASDYGKLYWMAIDQILERDRIIQPKPDAMFYAALPPLPRSRRDHYRSLAQYYRALNALQHGKEDEGVSILEQLQTPQAFYALAQIYKISAEKVIGRQGEPDAEVRRRALLVKAKDALQSTMEKLNAQANIGGLLELDVSKSLEEITAALSTVTPDAATGASPQSRSVISADLGIVNPVTPQSSTMVGYSTPPSTMSRFATPRSLSGTNAQASASLLMELGQSVDFALRTMTQSQETLVRGIMEQNRALTNTCDGMVAQLRELTLTNKALVEEMRDIRRENSEYRANMESVRGRSQEESYPSQFSTPASHGYYQQVQSHPIQQYPQQLQQQLPQAPLQQLQQHCQQFLTNQQGFLPPTQTPKKIEPPPAAPLEMKPKPGSWACKDCYTRNEPTVVKCVACSCPNPSGPPMAPGLSAQLTAPIFPQAPISTFPSVTKPAATMTPIPNLGIVAPPATTAPVATSASIFGSKATTGPNFGALAAQGGSSGIASTTPSSPFQSFQGAGAQLFGNKTSTPVHHTRQESENDDSLETPFEPTAEFKPVIPLPALVEVKSGEEDEEVLFKERGKLYRWGLDIDGKTEAFKERGLGDLKILKHRTTGRIRILMRREQVLKICANHVLQAGMNLSPMQKSDRAFIWNCQDFADGELKNETLAIRFKETEQAKKFKDAFESAVAALEASSPNKSMASGQTERKESQEKKSEEQKPPLSSLDMFKPKPGSWECKDCYTRNEASFVKCVCCGCPNPSASSAPGFPPQSTAPVFPASAGSKPFSFTPPRFGLPPVSNPPAAPATSTPTSAAQSTANSTPSAPPSSTAPVFGLAPLKFHPPSVTSPPAAPTTTTSAEIQLVANFPSSTTTSAPTSSIFGSSKATTGVDFAALASGKTSTNTTSPFQSFQGFKGFDGAGAQLFASKPSPPVHHTRQESENDDSTDTPFEPTAEFKPLIPLPALVEVKSGEEDEEVLFKERAKLYRWGMDIDGKTETFKERGLGDLKILKHRETGRIRILMRREQVFKICANHTIVPGMNLSPMHKSDRAYIWNCQDFADGELKNETLAVRFKEPEQAKKFKDVFESAVAASPSKSMASGQTETKESQDKKSEEQPPLSSLEQFKPKPGSWECKDCYTRNEPTIVKCVCCGSSNPNAPPSAPGLSAQSTAPIFPQPAISTYASVAKPSAEMTPIRSLQSHFGIVAPPAATVPTSTSIFGSSKATTLPNFGALASQNGSSGMATTTSTSPFQSFQGFKGFHGAGAQLFGNKTSTPLHTRQESENDDSTDSPFEPTAEFKPVIPLPALVEVKSGEEDEEVLFKERGKLYRWGLDIDGKTETFKERGLGDLKILKHRTTGRIRILMRREQVWKICANHAIVPGMKLSPMKNSDRAFIWNCQDFADGELKNETLAIRFKEPEQAKRFKEIFESAANTGLSGNAGGDIGKVTPKKEGSILEDEDVSVVLEEEETVNKEQESLAEKYQLPKSFYMDRKPCPGCIGCASDEAQDKILQQLGHHQEE